MTANQSINQSINSSINLHVYKAPYFRAIRLRGARRDVRHHGSVGVDLKSRFERKRGRERSDIVRLVDRSLSTEAMSLCAKHGVVQFHEMNISKVSK